MKNEQVSLNQTLSRRQVLGLMAAGGAGALTAACGVSTATHPVQKVNAGQFKISTAPGITLPTDDVTLNWVSTGGLKEPFFQAFLPAYTKKHPNIHINYNGTSWNTIQQEVLLGMERGTAPDLFELPPSVTAAQAVQNHWVGDLDSLIPDLAALKKRYPPGFFHNGGTDFGGKTYGFPTGSNARFPQLMLYNPRYMKAAGYDPSKNPLTWDEFRTALRKITKAGNGQYYGIITGLTQAGQLSTAIDRLAEGAGAHGAGNVNTPSPYTGTYSFTTDQYLAATELMLAVKSDGSFFPGSTSIDGPGAQSRFPIGVAGVYFNGTGQIVRWNQSNPEFKVGAALPPVQMSLAKSFPFGYTPGGGDVMFRSVNTKLGPVIGDIFNYMSTLNGQIQWADYVGLGNPPAFPNAIKHVKLDPLLTKVADWTNKYMVLLPYPPAKNTNLATVLQLFKTPTPNWSETIVGLYTGQISSSPKAALADVQNRYEAALETAIQATNKKLGTNITQDDFKVRGWNPRQSADGYYTSS